MVPLESPLGRGVFSVFDFRGVVIAGYLVGSDRVFLVFSLGTLSIFLGV